MVSIIGNAEVFSSIRAFDFVNNQLSTTMERLSTGIKINRASDDAANLSLSKKLDSHISDSKAYQRNANDALHMLNIADGDLGKMQENLQRLRTLAVQGMNDVYSDSEKALIKQEVDELALEIDFISKSSSFSDKSLLNGSVDEISIQVASDLSVSTSCIDLTAIVDELDFVDVLTEKEQLYFLNMVPGGSYYAEFDNRIYNLQNTSTENRNLIYRYEEDTSNLIDSIEFIEGASGITKSVVGEYDNTQVQMVNGERYLEVAAGDTAHVRVGGRVFDITNSSGTDSTAVFTTSGNSINIESGNGISGSYEYSTSGYSTLSGNEYALDFAGGETKQLEFAGHLYDLENTSASSQTFIFRNTGSLTTVAGGASINVSDLGSMTNETVLSGTEKYVELSANETQYYEDGGVIYRLRNNTAQDQSAILSAGNSLLNGTASVSRAAFAESVPSNVPADSNYLELGAWQSKQVSDGTNLYTFTNTSATAQVALYDNSYNLTSGNGNVVRSVVSPPDFEDVTPDGMQEFTVDLTANSTEYVTVGNEIYQLDNTGNGNQTVTYLYDGVGKTLTDQSGGGTTGAYLNDLSSESNGLDYSLELSGGQTRYIEMGSDIFAVTNNYGAEDQTVLFDYTAGSLVTNAGSNVTIDKATVSSFGNVDAGDIMLNLNSGQTQHVTVGADTFSVENTLGASQSVLLSHSGGNLNVDSGSSLNISKHTNMDSPTAINSGEFYVNLASSETKYISRGGEFFEVQNNTADNKVAIFSQAGNNLNSIATSNVSDSHMGSESYEGTGGATSYYVELDANEQQFINIDGYAYELNNTAGVPQTEVMTAFGGAVTSANSNVDTVNIPLSNLDDYKNLLAKVDWSMETLSERRAALGSKMNILENAASRNSIREFNLKSANSIIRDTDMAKESAELIKNQMLQQAASSIFEQVKSLGSNTALQLLNVR